jgi:hypothetical protein
MRRHRTVAAIIEPPLPPLKAFAFVDFEAAFSTRAMADHVASYPAAAK